jgi:hypothetical protein
MRFRGNACGNVVRRENTSLFDAEHLQRSSVRFFAPVEERDARGHGFTRKIGDVVTISKAKLGALVNTVKHSTERPPWTFGAFHLMRKYSIQTCALLNPG